MNAVRVEIDIDKPQSGGRKRCGQSISFSSPTDEEQAATATGTTCLATKCALSQGEIHDGIQAGGGHFRRQRLLVLPVVGDKATERVDILAQECVSHLAGKAV